MGIKSKQNVIIFMAVVIALGVGLWYALSADKIQSPFSSEDVVATVNGETISRAAFQDQLAKAEKMNLGLKEKQLKTEVLDQMIGRILVEQAAEEKGITVKQEQVDAQIDRLVEELGGKQAFEQQLKKADLTREELKKRAREQLLVQSYVESKISEDKLKVTKQEVKNYLQQMTAQQGENATNTPSFDELKQSQKEQIKSQIRQRKQNQETQKLIEKLREQATIEKPF